MKRNTTNPQLNDICFLDIVKRGIPLALLFFLVALPVFADPVSVGGGIEKASNFILDAIRSALRFTQAIAVLFGIGFSFVAAVKKGLSSDRIGNGWGKAAVAAVALFMYAVLSEFFI